jgi:hypothetical protein
MNRILQMGGILLLATGVGMASGRHQQVKDPATTPDKPVSKGGIPKQAPIPKGAPRIVNPASPAARLFRMTPEEREHALEKLPNEKARDAARKELEWFDGLPKEQQDNQLRRLDRFYQLTQEQRAMVRGLIVEVRNLPPKRGAAVRQELYRLQQMTDEQREATLKRPMFQARFSQEELRIITGLADAWMGPVQ